MSHEISKPIVYDGNTEDITNARGLGSPDRERNVASLNRWQKTFDGLVGSTIREKIGVPLPGDENKPLHYVSPRTRERMEQLLLDHKMMVDEEQRLADSLENGLSKPGEIIAEIYDVADTVAYSHLLQQKAQNSDEELSEDQITLYRIAARVAAMGGNILPVTDFDGTMTEDPEQYIPQFPTALLEERLKQTRGNFREKSLTTAHAARTLLGDTGTIYQVSKEKMTFSEGAGEFIRFSNEEFGVQPIILSANFQEGVFGGLENLPEAKGNVRVLGIRPDSDISQFKGNYAKYIARHHPNYATNFNGDGSSDEDALNARGNVAFYGARNFRDEQGNPKGFSKKCQEAQVLYFTFDTQAEIVEYYKKVMALVPQMTKLLEENNDYKALRWSLLTHEYYETHKPNTL